MPTTAPASDTQPKISYSRPASVSAPHEDQLAETAPQPLYDSQEFPLFYLPTMLAVYTARHQRMPTSAESLRRHVFGSPGHAGCPACREETDFLVAHQKQFF